jgi:uncharacterized membrane protein YheB (UPF0754 family)
MPKFSPWLFTVPFVSAFIHWLAIRMALKLLFHPSQPKRILGFTVQGVIPGRRQQIAETLGRIVAKEMFSIGDIEQLIADPANADRILPLAEEHIDSFLRVRLKETMPMISLFIGEKTIGQLKSVFMKELGDLFPVVMRDYVSRLRHDLDLEQIVAGRIAGFSSDRLEALVNDFLAKEFRIVGLVGALLGFLIGWLLVLLTLVLN